MAVDAMDIDSSSLVHKDSERKRKHKNRDKDSSPTKKRKQTDASREKSKKTKAPESADPESPFALTTATLYLPLAPISISPTHALASLLAEHLSPLLLTYYPPLKGIILAYSNASIASKPPNSAARSSADPNPQPLTLATTADEYGVLYVYLTATFLVFHPQRGQTLDGWVNVQSEGFMGAVVLNLFSVGIERKRLPTNWTWVPPGEEGGSKAIRSAEATDDESSDHENGFDPAKEHFQPATVAAEEIPLDGDDEDDESATGYFQSVSGHRVHGSVKFRVVDIDVIPGSDRDRGFMSIEGTMLSAEEEEKLVEAERQGHAMPLSFISSSTRRSSSAIPITNVPPASAVQDVSVVEIDVDTDNKKKSKSKSKKKDKEKAN
ncbi:hypothetical protein N7510_010290 [Penicillium lagena]|uniref:uncharacterized protein n=1 Tax=Penicillium lagena TaxID=94218 RepID=UPI002541499D|nr:uncharacterized protein N7510_010290 [Penicillium lagena]KAJ5605136.1 hypothetical protein N7510_010290 [Penicillium lagena]